MKRFVIGSFIIAVASVAASAQSFQECEAIYTRFKEHRLLTDWEKKRMAVGIGKEYLQKCGSLPDNDAVRTYVKNQVEKIEGQLRIHDTELRFNAALKAKDNDMLVAVAKELIAMDRPYSLDLMLDIASVGFDTASATPPVDKYQADGLAYAKLALHKMAEGKTSGNSEKYGFYAEYKTAACSDGKLNATGWMNYTIGFITYGRLRQKKEAVPYLYSSTQIGCETKGSAEAFRLIGAWYLDDALALNAARDEKLKAAGDKETDDSKAILAKQFSLVDRAIDAYSRALKVASSPSSKATDAYKDTLRKKFAELFAFRFGGDVSGMDAYLAGVESRAMPDPSTPLVLPKQ